MTLNSQITPVVLLAGLLAAPGLVQAQHYPVGAEGLKGPTLPPPGLYLRDYNFGYYASRYPGGPPNFQADAYVNAPRLIWLTDYKICGANYGMDVIVPFGYKHVKFMTPGGPFDHTSFGLGDIQIEPLLLAWHYTKFDLAAGYAIWAPTGEFSPARPDHLGLGHWGHMLTLGGTYYFDTEKTWALSALNRYEFNHAQEQTFTTPGQTYTVEWGLSKTLAKVWDVGLIGYWQQQTTTSEGPGGPDKPGVVGLGPEISLACPKIMTFFSLRYAREMAAHDRPEGNTFSLTITKRF